MLGLALVALLVAGTVAAGQGRGPRRGPSVVVAVADTGINPYHEVYHRPSWTRHPCTWVEGYDDCDVPALPLSIGKYDSWHAAVEADRALWESVEVGRWYWIPRTNIIGAVCSTADSAVGTATSVGVEDLCILDEHGHGTGTTSSVLSEAPDALLLAHEGSSGAEFLEIAPVVPDIQSHSWGPPAPLPVHAGDSATSEYGVQFAGSGQDFPPTIFFLAAGNEAPFPVVLDASRVHLDVQVVGGGWPGYATAQSWTTYDFASWFCRPTAVADSITQMRPSYCGTSFAAPTAAGAAAAALLRIRRAEGYSGRSTSSMVSRRVSREAFLDALRRGASYAPDAKFPNEPSAGAIPLVPGHEYVWWGYGWLDSTVVDDIVDCARFTRCPEQSVESEAWNQARQDLRARQYQALPIPDLRPVQDDAGSGRDAGDTPQEAVEIVPGRVYDAQLLPVLGSDAMDTFAFRARAGQPITAAVSGVLGCMNLISPTGEELDSSCTYPGYVPLIEATAHFTGTYIVSYYYLAPDQPYRFGVTVDGSTPQL